MPKPILTPKQIAEKFLKPENKYCAIQKWAVDGLRLDLAEYIQAAIDDAVAKAVEAALQPTPSY